MSNGTFVLENKNGEVVRTFQWERPTLTLVYRLDTGRIEAVQTSQELDEQQIKYKLIAEVSQSEIQKKSLPIGSMGHLKWVSDIAYYRKEAELPEENEEQVKSIFKYSAITQISALILVLLLGYFLKPDAPLETQEVVVIPPRQEVARREAAPIVAPAENKNKILKRIVKRIQPKQKSIVSNKNTEKQKKSVTRRTLVTSKNANVGRRLPEQNMNKMGALGVLGQVNAKNPGTGLNLDGMKNKGGQGLGSGQGGGGYGAGNKGGFSGSLYGKGLVATAPGGGSSRAEGAGGYGTRGKGGGQAGYGNMSMVGSSAGYLEPMEDEVMVEGGLDRDQIAAVINRNRGQIIYCYEKGLQIQSALTGRVAVNFTIGTRGAVNVARVAHTSLHADNVEDCIIDKLKSWKFPRPVGNVQVNVTYPFVLKRLSQR
jgi:hypothetical protein